MTHLFVHYHLRPGGVTRVLQEQTAEFSRRGIPFLAISAGPSSAVIGEHREIPWLDYAMNAACGAEKIKQSIDTIVRDLPRPHIWHIHNPTLGCHPAMAALVHELARANERLILHIHDFAEDTRPDNLRRLQQGPPWFPCGERIHYVVLTQRDRDILCHAGLPEENITILGNPVTPHPLPVSARDKSTVLYPTRAITRKNIGEMLLLAALAPAGTSFATTLAPAASRYQDEYQHWQHTAKQLNLPVSWSIAETQPLPLEELITQSTHLLSTSTQEGFGMAFLESIAWQRPLIGRAIPHIQENLARHGIDHPFLYEGIVVDSLEFSRQPPARQAELIKRAQQDPASVQIVKQNVFHDASSWFTKALSNEHQALPLSLLAPFHPSHHGEAIMRIAQNLLDAPESHLSYLDADSICQSFSA
jgi:glycosyltransferase involved in cell wall biosynthesis